MTEDVHGAPTFLGFLGGSRPRRTAHGVHRIAVRREKALGANFMLRGGQPDVGLHAPTLEAQENLIHVPRTEASHLALGFRARSSRHCATAPKTGVRNDLNATTSSILTRLALGCAIAKACRGKPLRFDTGELE